MKEYIEINGITFELSHVRKFFDHINSGEYHHKSLYQMYHSPSMEKVRIYEKWFTWFDTTKDDVQEWEYSQTFGCRSANTFIFTIGMTMRYQGTWYYIVITPSRNIAFILQ